MIFNVFHVYIIHFHKKFIRILNDLEINNFECNFYLTFLKIKVYFNDNIYKLITKWLGICDSYLSGTLSLIVGVL